MADGSTVLLGPQAHSGARALRDSSNSSVQQARVGVKASTCPCGIRASFLPTVAKILGLYNDSEPPLKTMHRGVLVTLPKQSAMTLPCGSGSLVTSEGSSFEGGAGAQGLGLTLCSTHRPAPPWGHRQLGTMWPDLKTRDCTPGCIQRFPPFVRRYEADDINEEAQRETHPELVWVILLPQWKANPETDSKSLFGPRQGMEPG
ncbi:SAGA-associated factor 29 [Plecturocebus cupreus]